MIYKVLSIRGPTVKVQQKKRLYDSKYKMFYYKIYSKLVDCKLDVKVNDMVEVVFKRKLSNRKSGRIIKVI